jgi:histidine ammonia-lyase
MLLRPGELTLEELRAIHGGAQAIDAGRKPQPLVMDPRALPGILASAAVVKAAAEGNAAVYGVNTGFGKLASTRISAADLATLQLNLIRSHSAGVGEPLAPAVLRLMLATKAASLARGYSGVRPVVIDTLLAVHNAGLVPVVPSQGSVGASGDLAPLAHMTLALLGEGEFLQDGQRVPAAAVLAQHGIAPLVLSAKEGLALINGTQTSTALALHALFSFEPVLARSCTRHRCADGGRRARQRRAVRPPHPRLARPAGADRSGAALPCLAGRQRHPCVTSGRR